MKIIVALVIFGACIFSTISAQTTTSALTIDSGCNVKIQQFRDCDKKIWDQRQSERENIDSDLSDCFETSGCPVAGPLLAEIGRGRCYKDVKAVQHGKIKICVQTKIQGLTLPQDNQTDEEHRGKRRSIINKLVNESCSKARNPASAELSIRACFAKVRNESRLTPDQAKQRFDSNCKAKAQCDAILDANCKTQLDAAEKAFCECRQQVHDSESETDRVVLFASTPSCAGITAPEGFWSTYGQKQKSCDNSGGKDYCKLGFDAWKADQKAKKSNKQGGH